jgi:molybdate transport system ATP-binding protein
VLKLDIGKQLGAFRLQAAFEAPSRGATVVFGPSGAGKSALLAAIAGLQRPDQGSITLDGDTLFDGCARHRSSRRRTAASAWCSRKRGCSRI